MSSKHEAGKVYAVFIGRQPGIYWNQLECEAQVNEWEGGLYSSFNSVAEAEEALQSFLQHQAQQKDAKSLPAPTAPHNIAGESSIRFADEGHVGNTLLNFSLQGWLRYITSRLGCGQPTYTENDSAIHCGRTFYQYYVSIESTMFGDPPISMGRYASSEEAAREDAAMGMLKILQIATGKPVVDFNFFNVQALQARISELECENFDLVFENALLKKQSRTLTGANPDDDNE